MARKSSWLDYFRSTDGNALVLAIVVSAILLIVMLVGILLIRQQTHLISGSRRKSEALSVAEAGLDAAVWRLERNQTLDFTADGDGDNSKYTLEGYNSQGKYKVTFERPVSGNSFYYVVTSEGTQMGSNFKKTIRQDVYYINLSRSIYSYSGTNGGGQMEGNLNIKGPFYSSGNLTLSGNVGVFNLENTTGNPIMVRGNLVLNSNSVKVGGNTASLGPNSPMAVFVKGSIIEGNPQGDQVFNLISKQVPEVTLPKISRTQYLDAAQENDNAVYTGNLLLDNNIVRFGQRSDGSYTFEYDGTVTPASLKVEGIVFIDGILTFNKALRYEHGTGYTRATIFADDKIEINQQIVANEIVGRTYPEQMVLALVNEDQTPLVTTPGFEETVNTYDIKVDGTSGKKVQAFLYTGGQITILKQIVVHGSVMAYLLWLEQVPTLEAPLESAQNNFPLLFPGRDLAFIVTTNWREVSNQ